MFEGPQAVGMSPEPAWVLAAWGPESEVSPGLRVQTASRWPVLQPGLAVVREAPGPVWLHAAVGPGSDVFLGLRLRMSTALCRPVLQPGLAVVREPPGPVGLEPDVPLGLLMPVASGRPVLQRGPPLGGPVARGDCLEPSFAAFVVWVGEMKTMVERWT